MFWWSHYDYRKVQEDFQFLVQTSLRVIRIFLNWEDFQPWPDLISEKALEQDRHMHPQIIAGCCDYLSRHAYPFSLSWVEDTLDPLLPVFLACVTAWLGQKPVLIAEWGAPTLPVIVPFDAGRFFHGFAADSFYNNPTPNLVKMFAQIKLLLKEQV